jgi:hypothetical protein
MHIWHIHTFLSTGNRVQHLGRMMCAGPNRPFTLFVVFTAQSLQCDNNIFHLIARLACAQIHRRRMMRFMNGSFDRLIVGRVHLCFFVHNHRHIFGGMAVFTCVEFDWRVLVCSLFHHRLHLLCVQCTISIRDGDVEIRLLMAEMK